jgi:hypothetical protein
MCGLHPRCASGSLRWDAVTASDGADTSSVLLAGIVAP